MTPNVGFELFSGGPLVSSALFRNCVKSTDRSHAQLLLTIVSPWRSLSHTHTHTLTHTHSNVVYQDVPALYDSHLRRRRGSALMMLSMIILILMIIVLMIEIVTVKVTVTVIVATVMVTTTSDRARRPPAMASSRGQMKKGGSLPDSRVA